MELKIVEIKPKEGWQIILGQSHFIKTVEDLTEAIVTTAPQAKFAIAFCEASGPKLVRYQGNDEELLGFAKQKAFEIGAGHCFLIVLKGAFPINVLNQIKNVQEVCNIYCATGNPVQVIIAETEQGRGILGVVDGYSPKGIETEEDIKKRKEFLREIGYKF